MQTRVSLTAAAILLWLASIVIPSTATAQIRIVEPPQASADAIQQLLDQGRKLEKGGSWGDALTHYEEALHEHPKQPALQQRHDLARIHYDLSRRYRDASFRSAVGALSQQDALEIYREVAIKVDAHYVRSPDWSRLVAHGSLCLRIALGEDEFRRRNLRGVAQQRIEAARRALPRISAAMRVGNRDEAQQAVAAVAQSMQRRIGLAPAATVLEYTAGTLSALDAYSSYLTADQLRDVFSQIDGSFVGLGVELKADTKSLIIVHVIQGSPAAKAEIRGGDRVLAVDGRSTVGMTTDDAAELLQGKEGTVVRLKVVTAGQPPREVFVRRAHVEIPSIEKAHIIDRDAGVAYLKLASFQKSTERELQAALWKLHRQGMRSLIIDLRGNPGGLLTASVEAADKFIRAGTIVSTNGRSIRERFTHKAQSENTWRVPLVVLVDGDSASASEIFAGAIQDHRRGTIVGQRSFGKGSVQGIFPLRRVNSILRCGIRLTTAKFYSPSGRAISDAGVTPEIVVRRTAKPVAGKISTGADDPFISAGLRAARRQLAQR